MPLTGTSIDDLRVAIRQALPTAQQATFDRGSDAVMLVEYRREHFAHLGSATRFTLDYDIRFTQMLGQRHVNRRFTEQLHGVALIECKVPANQAQPPRGALSALRSRPRRFSKYVLGCQQFGLANCA